MKCAGIMLASMSIAVGAFACKTRNNAKSSQVRGATENGDEDMSGYTASPPCGGLPACDPKRNPLAALAAIFEPLTKFESDQYEAWAATDVVAGGPGATGGSGSTWMALSDAPLLTPEQRQQLLNERIKELAARKAQLVQENPAIEFKSYKCSQRVEKQNYSYGAAQAGISTPQVLGSATLSVVVFFQSMPDDSVREFCRAKLASDEVRAWYIQDKETSYANVKGWFNVGDVQYDGPRKHGNDLATEDDFKKLVAREDGQVNFVAQYFHVSWFVCTTGGVSCWNTWHASNAFCRDNGGRLMTMSDMKVEAANIVATFEGPGKTVNGDSSKPYLWTTDREYQYGGSTVYPTYNWTMKGKHVRMENRAQIACAHR